MIRVLLCDSGLGKEYWGEALNTAVFLKNRTASRVLDWKSPYEVWFNEKPKLENLKLFGSKAIVRIPTARRISKLDQQGIKATFLGYDITSKNYRLLDVESGRVIKSRDVAFFENDLNQADKSETIGRNPTLKDNDDDDDDDNVYDNNSSTDVQGIEDVNVETKLTEENNFQRLDSLEHEDSIYYDPLDHDTDSTPVIENDSIASYDNDELDDTFLGDNTKESYTTRSGRKTFKPVNYHSLSALIAVGESSLSEVENPSTYKEALESPQKDEWIQSMQEELKQLLRNQTWEVTELPKGRRKINCKWVYRVKYGTKGEVLRFKSRLVAKGFNQVKGLDYTETYAPVASYISFRIMLALAASKNLRLYHYDFKNAYLNGTLNDGEEIYMSFPEGYYKNYDSEKYALRLKKCIYGLKQSGKNWNTELNDRLLRCGLTRCKSDQCLYIRHSQEKFTMVLVYVDDIAVATNDESFVQDMKKNLQEKFEMKDLGEMKQFLGIRIREDQYAFTMDQSLMVKQVLKLFKMEECRNVSTPSEVQYPNEIGEDTDIDTKLPFRKAVGCLLYLSTISRPDISFAVLKLAKVVDKAKQKHWIQTKRLLRYLKGTIDYHIAYKKGSDLNLKLYADADFGNDEDRKSVSGFVALMSSGPIAWYSRTQSMVALSTMEAEYISLANALQESLHIKHIMEEIFDSSLQLEIQVDNQSCISYAKNYKGPGRSKHISIKFHFVKDYVDSKIVQLKYVATNENAADIFTKSLPRIKHQAAVELLGLQLFYVEREC